MVPLNSPSCLVAPSLRWVPWTSVPHLHQYYGQLRFPLPPLDDLRLSLARRYLEVALFSHPTQVKEPLHLTGHGDFSIPNPLLRFIPQGEKWISQVPEFPLCVHAPFSDPGGSHTPPPLSV